MRGTEPILLGLIEGTLVTLKVLFIRFKDNVVVKCALVEVLLLTRWEIVSDLLLRENRFMMAIGNPFILIALTRIIAFQLLALIIIVITRLYFGEYSWSQGQKPRLQSLLLPLHAPLQHLASQVAPEYLLYLDCSLHLPLVFPLDGRAKLPTLNQVGWLYFDGDAVLLLLRAGSLLVGENDLAIDAALVIY